MLARLFVIIGGFLVLALTAVLVAPYFIDWTGYRADFERQASAVLGRKVSVKGEAYARLLPFPSVTFSDVTVEGGADGKPALTVESFSMDAELAPFMSGEFLIFDMRMGRPKGQIDVAADGTIDWAMRPTAPFDISRISLEKLTITEGQVAIRHAASGRTHLVSELNAEVSAKALRGPWRVTGSARLDGMLTELSVSTGAVDEAGAMRLRVRAEPATHPAVVEADGNVRFDKGSATYAGGFKISPKAEPTDKQEASADNPGYRLSGTFAVDHRRLSVEEFLFETGPLENPYAADGRGHVEFGVAPSFALSLDGAQVRLDEAIGAAEENGALTLEERLAALEETLLDLPKPSMAGTIDINLPAIVAGDTTIRDVRLAAEPAAGGWTIKSFAATLPGRATLEGGGKLSLEDRFGFSGFLLLAVGQPSGFAAWLSKDVDDAVRRLPAAGFSARVDLTAHKQSFANLELALGSATFHGEAESLMPADARPSAVLKLEGGALDVEGLQAFASLFVGEDGVKRFADRDLDLAVKAGPVSVAGLTAETVDAALRFRHRALEIDRLAIAGLEGATISATGRLTGLPEDAAGKLDASILAVDLAPLVAAAAARFGENALLAGLDRRAAAYPGLLADARLDLLATADEGGISLGLEGSAGGTKLAANFSAKGRADALAQSDLSLTVEGQNQDVKPLLALYGLPVLPMDTLGAAQTEFKIKGRPDTGLQTTASLKAEDFTAVFLGTTGLAAQGVTAKGRAIVESADIEPWLAVVGGGMPGMGMGTAVDLAAEADFGDGLLVLSGLEGTVGEGAVSGDINVEMKDGRPHLTGQLDLDELDLEPLVAMVLGAPALESGGGTWSEVPFQPAETAPFSAEIETTADTVSAGAAVTGYEGAVTLRFDRDGLRLGNLKARLFDGEIAGLVELKNNGGTALLSSQLKLGGADLVAALGETGVTGEGDFTTAVTASGKSVGGLVASLSGSGTAALRSLSIAGINPAGFKSFLAAADQAGKDVDAAKTAAFAPQIAAAGSFAAEPLEVALTLAGGVLRAPPLKLANPAAAIDAHLQIDLNRMLVSAEGTVSYDPGEEALVGSEPALRFELDEEGRVVFDSEPLAGFLTQRALEIEQARVEALQAALLEKQRLRREVRYYAALDNERQRAAEELRRQQEAARLRAEEEARLRMNAEEAAKSEAEAKLRLENEAKLRLEQELAEAEARAKKEADEAAKRDADARAKAEAEARPRPRPAAPAPEPSSAGEAGIFEPSIDGFFRSLGGTN